jgi:hypothetical protein
MQGTNILAYLAQSQKNVFIYTIALAYLARAAQTWKKSLTTLSPVANVIKLFTAVSYNFS